MKFKFLLIFILFAYFISPNTIFARGTADTSTFRVNSSSHEVKSIIVDLKGRPMVHAVESTITVLTEHNNGHGWVDCWVEMANERDARIYYPTIKGQGSSLTKTFFIPARMVLGNPQKPHPVTFNYQCSPHSFLDDITVELKLVKKSD